MVAGHRAGKSSFLRLLIDTSNVAPSLNTEQRNALAKFLHGSVAHTNTIRYTSLNFQVGDPDLPTRKPAHGPATATLALIDTPSIDWHDGSGAERLISDILRNVEARFAESLDKDSNMADGGDNHVHLCLYFLNPDSVLPPAAPTPLAPLVPRSLGAATSGNGYSQSDPEPVILEPPVASKPLPPNLSQNDINTIRRLSTRVNVLPVIGRADTLSNERLAAVKMAVRKDLAAVGIGFGVFDLNPTDIYHPPRAHSANGDSAGSTRKQQQQQQHNGRASAPGAVNGTSPPASPPTPLLRLPYALISPDLYSHSDGVPRIQPPRHEILNHYFPFQQRQPPSPTSSSSGSSALPKGVYTRTYRWGALDVLDPNHNDFVPLRAAIFQQMETLQKYTRDYLLDKYRTECPPPARHGHAGHNSHPHSHSYPTPQSQSHPLSVSHLTSPGPESISSRKPTQQQQQLPPLTPASRPILAIDTQARGGFGSSSRSLPPHNGAGPEPRALPPGSAHDSQQRSPYVPKASIPRSPTQHLGVISLGGINKQRQKKITVACNFCRSRKLKCDGGRPACSQCIKRSVNCDYISTPHGQNSRRRTKNHQRDVGAGGSGGAGGSSGGGQGGRNGDSDSELSDAEERSADGASMSPEVPAEQLRERERGGYHAYPQQQPLHHHPSHHHQHHQPHQPHYPHQQMGVPKLHEYPSDIYHKTTGRPPSSNSGHREHDRERERDRDRERDNNSKPYYSSEYDLPAIVSLPPPPPVPGSPILPPPGLPQRAGSAGPGSASSPAARPRAAPVSAGPTSRPRQPSTTGPKVVACNNCRARKTKCDGAHPACAGCVRRSLACNYVHDGNGTGRRGGARRSAPKAGGGGGGGGGGVENGPDASPNPNANASLRPAPSSRSNSGDGSGHRHGRGENDHRPGSEENRSGSGSNGHDMALKRSNINDGEGYDYEGAQPYKKSRIDLDPQLLPPTQQQSSTSVSGVA